MYKKVFLFAESVRTNLYQRSSAAVALRVNVNENLPQLLA